MTMAKIDINVGFGVIVLCLIVASALTYISLDEGLAGAQCQSYEREGLTFVRLNNCTITYSECKRTANCFQLLDGDKINMR